MPAPLDLKTTKVGSLVDMMKKKGKDDLFIADYFTKRFGAPHYNIPFETTLEQAQRQSPAEIQKRGKQAAKGYEEIFFKPEASVLAPAVEAAAQEPAPTPTPTVQPPVEETPFPTVEEDAEASGSEEAAEEVRQQFELARKEAALRSPTEMRGGFSAGGPMESLKRAGGAFVGAGEWLWEGTPWGQKPQEEPGPRAMESAEEYAARTLQATKERQTFENVARDPNASLGDLLKATPAGQKIVASQAERAKRYESKPVRGALLAAIEDIGDLVTFLPNLAVAPVAAFEAPKGKPSFEVGVEQGRELVPTMAVGSALTVPGIDLAQQFKVAPVTTLFQYMPLMEAAPAGMRMLAGKYPNMPAAKRLLNSANEVSRVVPALQKSFASALDTVGRRLGIDSQSLMDRFYNKDPHVTALLEDAFGQNADIQRAVKKLGDIWTSQREKEIALPDDDIFVKKLDDIANVIKRTGYKKPDGGLYTVPELKDLVRNEISNAISDEPISAIPKDAWVPALKKMNLSSDDIQMTLRYIQQQLKDSPNITLGELLNTLRSRGTTPNPKLFQIFRDVSKEFWNIADPKRVISPALEKLATEATEQKTRRALEAAASKYQAPGTDAATYASVAGKPLPQALKVSGEQMKGLIDEAIRSENMPLAKHLQSMSKMPGFDGYVTEPFMFLSRQAEQTRAFRSHVSEFSRSLNQWIKSNVLPANAKAVISNFVGNAVSMAAKEGNTPWEQAIMTVTSANKWKQFVEGKTPKGSQTERSMSAALRSGIFDSDRLSADIKLYEVFEDPQTALTPSVMDKVVKVLKKPAEVGGSVMQWGDEAAKVRLWDKKFSELSGYVDSLKDGEMVRFPTGPNTVMTITKDKGNIYKVSESVYTTAKGGLMKKSEPWYLSKGELLDDAVGRGAAAHAQELIFDYSRVPGMLEAQRRTPLIGAASPFFTFQWKAMSLPGKRGLVSPIFSATDRVTSTSPAVNAQLFSKGMNTFVRKALLAAGAKTTAQEDEARRLASFDPSTPGVVRIVGPTTDSSVSDIMSFTSANWMDGVVSALQLVEGGIDAVSDSFGTSEYKKYLAMSSDPNIMKDPTKTEERKAAYYAAMADIKNRAMTPEVLPNVMKVMGLGGSVFFDAFAKAKASMKTGEVGPNVVDTTIKFLIPNFFIKSAETVLAGTGPIGPFEGPGTKQMVGVPEGGKLDTGIKSALMYAFANFTGLAGTPVDTTARADAIEKSFVKEMRSRLDVWKKGRQAELSRAIGDESARKQLTKESELLDDIIIDAADMWRSSLTKKGIADRKRSQPKETDDDN